MKSVTRSPIGPLQVGTIGFLMTWAAAALAFALWRTPYDDEWFSLTLAGNTNWSHFWRSLNADVHPPWVALFDRALTTLGWRWPIHAVRVAFSAWAIGLTIGAFQRRLSVPRIAWVLAALHPIVFMYGGAARWYPFVFLAQALRLWALFRPGLGVKIRGAAFVLGALLGPAASYVDLPFVAIDSVFLICSRSKTETSRWTIGMVTMAATGVAALALLSPLDNHPLRMAQRRATNAIFKGTATWALLGPTGEAHLPDWSALLGLIALPALLAGITMWIAGEWKKGAGPWGIATGVGWLLATALGVWHPRYSLLPWFIATSSIGLLFVRNRLGRVLAGAAALFLFFATCLTVTGRFFIKNDLNELDVSLCPEMLASRSYDLIVAPYPRTRAQIARTCQVKTAIMDVPWIPHYRDPTEQLGALRTALSGAHDVLLVTTPAKGTSLETTYELVRTLLTTMCVLRDDRRFGIDSNADLKSLFKAGETQWRFCAQWWTCAAGHDGPR